MSEDIIENLSMASPADPWFWPKVLAVVAALALAAVWYGIRLARGGKLPFQRPPPPPEDVSLERLAALRPLIGKGLVREFVEGCSDVLRAYIEVRFGLRAPKLSTEEFLFAAERGEELDAPAREQLAAFLFRCDRVKFALGTIDIPGMEDLFSSADTFIRRSAPQRAEGGAP